MEPMEKARKILKEVFGYDQFRPFQADIIQSVLEGRDTLALMPTGGGKSLCYQIPALALDGVALVLSPLIALMKDQVESLRANGVQAAFLNSTLNAAQARQVEDDLLAGHIKLLYVSPEKLLSPGFQPLLRSLRLSFFAIDEAHCISSWGHDFRPEYTQLRFLRQQFPQLPMIALTATADKTTREDIAQQLQLQNPQRFVASFDRPNLFLRVAPGQKRREQILRFIRQRAGQSGIIYCLARKTCVDLANMLVQAGIKAAPYHAELDPSMRNRIQDDFISDRTQIVCATVAFGMGIDKSNVRYVIHYNMPRNLESYYQEIGRAGRDGLPSDTLMFFSFADVSTYRDMFEKSEGGDEIKTLKLAKLDRMYEFAQTPICRRRMVLAYFGESHPGNCKACDVCENPPQYFDAVIEAQKALSAIKRAEEKIGINMLIDILRGSRRAEIFQHQYHLIKTYGAGQEHSFQTWRFYLSQMLNMGLIEVVFNENNRLRVTEAGMAVLFQGQKVWLAKEPPARETVSKTETLQAGARDAALFNELVQLRRGMARERGIPPYIIFSDATLEAMSAHYPTTAQEMLDIPGVGQFKLQQFAEPFMQMIATYVAQNSIVKQTPAPQPTPKDKEETLLALPSLEQSLRMHQAGYSIDEIAEMRGLKESTVIQHLITSYRSGEEIDLSTLIFSHELDLIVGALPLFPQPYKLRDIFEHFNGQVSYDKIHLAIAYAQRQT